MAGELLPCLFCFIAEFFKTLITPTVKQSTFNIYPPVRVAESAIVNPLSPQDFIENNQHLAAGERLKYSCTPEIIWTRTA